MTPTSTASRESAAEPAAAISSLTSLFGRLSGLTTILSGPLWALGAATALNADALGIAMRGPHLLLTLAGLLSLIGLARLARYHAGHDGRAGMAGILVAGAGVVLIVASKNVPARISEEAGWALFDVGGLLLVVGSLVAGIVALLAGKAWLLGGPLVAIGVLGLLQLVFLMFLSAETGLLGTVVVPVLIGVAWTVLGYGLWSYRSETSPATGAPRESATAPDYPEGQAHRPVPSSESF